MIERYVTNPQESKRLDEHGWKNKTMFHWRVNTLSGFYTMPAPTFEELCEAVDLQEFFEDAYSDIPTCQAKGRNKAGVGTERKEALVNLFVSQNMCLDEKFLTGGELFILEPTK